MTIVTTFIKIFKKVLTIGTPPDDDVLYSKVVKRKIPDKSAEALVVEDFKNTIHNVKSKFLNTDSPVEEKKTESIITKSKPKVSTAKKTATKATEKKPSKKTSTKKAITKSTEKKTLSSTQKATTKVSDKKVITKKTVTKKSTPSKKTATDTIKKTTIQKGGKRAEKIALYIKDIKKHYGAVDEDFVAIIVKNLGPSIYRKDAELVSCSDSKELDTVRRNFLVKKLELQLSKEELDTAIQEVCQELKSTRIKYRATFYYRLAQKFKKESTLS